MSYPGTFAAGRLDEGTALLLSAMPPLPAGARVLDYGCGSGGIAAGVLALQPTLTVDALDNDAVALEAARENVPTARLILGIRIADAGRTDYDAILSNPPLHEGIAEDHAMLDRLVADAPSHLLPGGLLQIVVQRRVPLERRLAKHFASARIVAQTGRYRVWRARLDPLGLTPRLRGKGRATVSDPEGLTPHVPTSCAAIKRAAPAPTPAATLRRNRR